MPSKGIQAGKSAWNATSNHNIQDNISSEHSDISCVPISPDPFVNFEREVRKLNTGLSIESEVKLAADLWTDMPINAKEKYILEAARARANWNPPTHRRERDSLPPPLPKVDYVSYIS